MKISGTTQPKVDKIKVGEKIIVDKGILGIDKGTLLSVEGYSAFGFSGLYKSDIDGEEHIYDQTVHNISRKTMKNKPKVDKLASARTPTKGVASIKKANQHEQKVDNKWEKEFEKFISELTKDYEWGLTVEDEGKLWSWILALITQTQQETLEWCLEVVKQRKLAKDPVTEIIETIKKKMGGGK